MKYFMFFTVVLLFAYSSHNTAKSTEISPEIIQLAYKGDYEAQYLVGRAVLLNEMEFTNQKLAMRWLDRAIEKHPKYARHIGLQFKENVKQAAKWYKKAVHYGYKKALLDLGYLHSGEKTGFENNAKAKNYFEQAISSNVTDAYAPLGYLYMKGLGTATDLSKAEELYNQAIQHGDSTGYYFMGLLKQFHKAEPNIKEAISQYIVAAKKGYPAAPMRIVRAYVIDQAETGLTQEEALFWKLIAQKWGTQIIPSSHLLLTNGLIEIEIQKIDEKAETLFKSFSH